MQPDSWQPTPEEVNTRREKNEPLVAWWRGHVTQPWWPARLWTERGVVSGDFYGTRVLARSMGGMWGGWAFTPDEIGYIQGAIDVERDRAARVERHFDEADAEAGHRLGDVRRERDKLLSENKKLRFDLDIATSALAPFAATADEIPGDVPSDQLVIKVGHAPGIVIGHLRVALAAWSRESNDADEKAIGEQEAAGLRAKVENYEYALRRVVCIGYEEDDADDIEGDDLATHAIAAVECQRDAAADATLATDAIAGLIEQFLDVYDRASDGVALANAVKKLRPRAQESAAGLFQAAEEWGRTKEAMDAEDGVMTAKGDAHARATEKLADAFDVWRASTT